MPDQSQNFVLKGLGGLGRIVNLRPIKGVADASAEIIGLVLQCLLAFWKCGNDIVSLMASIITVSSQNQCCVLVWLFSQLMRSFFMTSLRLPMCSVGKSALLSRL